MKNEKSKCCSAEILWNPNDSLKVFPTCSSCGNLTGVVAEEPQVKCPTEEKCFYCDKERKDCKQTCPKTASGSHCFTETYYEASSAPSDWKTREREAYKTWIENYWFKDLIPSHDAITDYWIERITAARKEAINSVIKLPDAYEAIQEEARTSERERCLQIIELLNKEKDYCKGFKVNSSTCNHCHQVWYYKQALSDASAKIKEV